MATYIEQSLTKLKEFEGCVPWMYRDTMGRITVGVGLMLPNPQAAQKLPFLSANRAATVEEIAAEFARVKALPEARNASFYKTPASLLLSQQTIDHSLTTVLEGFEADLRKHLPHYDALPDCVKLALLDMIYNLGPIGLFQGFPHLVAAVETSDWAQAAARCLRRGPGPARNAWTRQQFLDAVATEIKAEAEGWFKRLWYKLRSSVGKLFGRD